MKTIKPFVPQLVEHYQDQEWRNRGRFYQTPEWESLRLATFERDDYICQKCKAKGESRPKTRDKIGLVAHHKIERVNGGPDELENLTTMCRSCHARLPRK